MNELTGIALIRWLESPDGEAWSESHHVGIKGSLWLIKEDIVGGTILKLVPNA